MRTRNVLIALAAVVMFALPAMASPLPEDECATTGVGPGGTIDTCAMTPSVPQLFGSCWSSGDGNLDDGWMSFTATDTRMRVRTDLNSAAPDAHITVFDACGGNEIACDEDSGGAAGYNNDICVSGLTKGTTYFVQVSHWSAGACGNYVVDVENTVDGNGETGTCGNNDIDNPCEQCDGTDNDACELSCDAKCQCVAPVCGNGIIGPGEDCDDGNNDDGDGCSLTCTVEPGCECTGEPSVCTCCGDGVVEGSEACDDSNTSDGDCCSSTCTFDSAGTPCGSNRDTQCDNPDTCNGSGSCQANHEPGGSTVTCGSAETLCTNQDFCAGDGTCMDNGLRPVDSMCAEESAPTISEWGMASLSLVLLTGLTLKFRKALPKRA